MGFFFPFSFFSLYDQYSSWTCLSKTVPPQKCLVHYISEAIYLQSYVVELHSNDAGLIDLVSKMCKCATYDQTHRPKMSLMIAEASKVHDVRHAIVWLHCGLTATLSGWTAELQQQLREKGAKVDFKFTATSMLNEKRCTLKFFSKRITALCTLLLFH